MKETLVLLSVLVFSGGSCASTSPDSSAAPPERLCPAGENPRLEFSLTEGTVTAELFESAAPGAVRQVVDLARAGSYDGKTFDYTNPHLEIITAGDGAEEASLIEKELDAGALGIDQVTVDGIDRAMDVFQFEIFKAFTANKKRPITPRMKEWLEAWEKTNRAEFLVGVSRQEINEALGYVYAGGLDSRPVTRGAITLKPASPTHSTTRLSIALSDIPERTGRHVVIGQVDEGLDLADGISIRPLDVPPGRRSYTYQPRDPVVIEAVHFECRARSPSARREP